MQNSFSLIINNINNKNLTAARNQVQELMLSHPNDEHLLLLNAEINILTNNDALARSLIVQAFNSSSNPDLLITFIIRLFKHKGIENALFATELALQRYKDSYHLLNIYGVLLKTKKSFTEALKVFSGAISINPQEASALINKGNTHVLLQQYNEALAC